MAFARSAPSSAARPATKDLCWTRRLQHLRDLLTASGPYAADATLGLFSATGFTDELTVEAAASRCKILLATVDDLYSQPS